MKLYELNNINLLNWITAFVIFEIPLALFFIKISKNKKNTTVTNWYSGENINIFNVLIQDATYAFCGIIIALNLFKYLVSLNIIKYSFKIYNFIIIYSING